MSVLNLKVSKNETICGCDANIIIKGEGGFPPYNYSIDNGLTYKSSPIFNNLCFGNYSIYIMDNSGNTSSTVTTIAPPPNPITYTVRLLTSNTTQVNTPTQNTKIYTTILSVSPELPQGVTLTLDFNHLSVFNTSPNSGSSNNITTTILYKNELPISMSYSSSTNSTTLNTIPGCQLNSVYITSNLEKWVSITYTSGDEIKLITSSTLNKLESTDCYFSNINQNYQVNNLSLFGCGCCNILSL